MHFLLVSIDWKQDRQKLRQLRKEKNAPAFFELSRVVDPRKEKNAPAFFELSRVVDPRKEKKFVRISSKWSGIFFWSSLCGHRTWYRV